MGRRGEQGDENLVIKPVAEHRAAEERGQRGYDCFQGRTMPGNEGTQRLVEQHEQTDRRQQCQRYPKRLDLVGAAHDRKQDR